MKRYNITVNGKAYDVAVEEVGGSAAVAPVACSSSSRCTCCRWHKGNSSNAWYYP